MQNKQEQLFLALSRYRLELNKYYYNSDTLGLKASIMKLLQLSVQILQFVGEQEKFFLKNSNKEVVAGL